MMTTFGKTAIVKPDHIGDLILAAPTVSRLAQLSSEAVLFVSSQSTSLARYLFPYLEIRTLNLPHLVKGANTQSLSFRQLREMFAPFDVIFVLRSDAILNRAALRAIERPTFFTAGNPEVHETRSHAECLYRVVGRYQSDVYWPGRTLMWPLRISQVALVVGAGFPTNRWPAWYWARLAMLLQRRGRSVVLVGGPSEIDLITTVAQIIGLSSDHCFIGSSDNIRDMLKLLSECDVAVATDGGSGHLASLACPVLSLFTSSPYKRFAPFGRENRLVTLELNCSPCQNADHQAVNLCLTHECSFGVLPETVLSALEETNSPAGVRRPLNDPYGAQLVFGTSHA
jgi:heptosyltransferase-2